MKKAILTAVMVALGLASPSSAVVTDIVTKSGAIPAPAPGKGQVIFYRTSAMGALLGCTARENNVEVVRLGVGKYYIVSVAPGVHEYSAKSIESKDKLKLEVEDGETYFVKCSIAMGFMSGRPKLSPSTEAEFAAKAAGVKAWEGPNAPSEGAAPGAAH